MKDKKMFRMSPLPALASLLMISSAIVSCSKTSSTPIASDASVEQLIASRALQDKDNLAVEKLSAADIYKLSGMDFKYFYLQAPANVTTTIPYSLINVGELDAASDKKANDSLTAESYKGDLRGSKMDVELKFAIPTSGKLKEAPVEADLKAVLYEIKAAAGSVLPKARVTTSAIAQDVAASIHLFNVFDPKYAHKVSNGHQYFMQREGDREIGAYMKHKDETHVDIVFIMREKATGKSLSDLIIHAVKDVPAAPAPAPAAAPAAPAVPAVAPSAPVVAPAAPVIPAPSVVAPAAPMVAAPAVVSPAAAPTTASPSPTVAETPAPAAVIATPAPTASPNPPIAAKPAETPAAVSPAPTESPAATTATPAPTATPNPPVAVKPDETPAAAASPSPSAAADTALNSTVSTDASHPNN